MLSCNREVPDRTDMAPVNLAPEYGETGVASGCNSEIGRPTADEYCRVAREDRE